MSGLGSPDGQMALLDEAGAPESAWRVRASPRARRLAVRVLPGGLVEIVVPHGTRPRAVERFVAQHRRWIERTLEMYRPADSGAGLPARIQFAATGRSWELRLIEGEGPASLQVLDNDILLSGGAGRLAALRHALQRFTMREAHASFAPWLERLSTTTGLHCQRLQIRRQRTRWGSCSRSGTISLNACLLFQPPEVVNYLLIHELAHTRHPDHSRRFWRLVATHEPRWAELDAALSRGWREVPAWAIGPGPM